jgi:hypothetical protein
MVDFNTYLSGELRQLAFRKSIEQTTWQEAVKQQRRIDLESRLGKLVNSNFLADMANALSFHIRHWRRTHRQATPQVTGLPSQPRSS